VGYIQIIGPVLGIVVSAIAIWQFILPPIRKRIQAKVSGQGASQRLSAATEGDASKNSHQDLRVPDSSHRYSLPLRNPNFTGRDDILDRLKQSLGESGQARVTQAIAGLGGVGKTQIAIEYVHRNLDRYGLIAWLRAEEVETLLADFAELAKALQLASVEGMPPDDLVRIVHAALAARSDWLLVFDNAEAPGTIRSYLPAVGNGHVLITSRDPNWRSFGEPIDVTPFERKESVTFLKVRSGDDDPEGADAVAEVVGDLPLALEQAGAYVASTKGKLKAYAALFEQRHKDLWKDQSPPDAYHGTVATTWSLALDKLKKQSPASIDLMRLIAFLGADDIPLSLLTQGAEELPKRLKKVLNDPVALEKTVAALRSHSLVFKEDDHIFVHRLVQLVVRDAMKAKDQARWIEACLELLKIGHDFRQHDPKTWEICKPLLPHVAAVTSYAEKAEVAHEATSYLLNNAGLCLRTLANPSLAKRYFERALKIDEAVYGPDHPNVAIRVNNLGGVLRDLGDHAGAKAAFERALFIDEAVYGPDHPEVAIDVNNLGGVLQDLGDHAGAKAAYERALTIDEAVYGPDHPNVAIRVNNLGGVLQDLGDHADAKAAFERALTIDEAVYGPDHPEVAIDVNNLGGMLRDLGDHAGAKAAFERALRIDEAVYGPDHPNVAIRVNNLGGMLRDLGDHAGAKAAYERALTIDEAVYGPDHPEVATDVNNLGGVLRDLGDHAGAKAAYERALTIDEAVYGPDHPEVATDVNNLGMVLQDLGDHAGAKAAFERALKIHETVFGPDHPSTKIIRKNLESLD